MSLAVKQQISKVAFKIWLKHDTFLVYRVFCPKSNKIGTHFQLWTESCVNRGYLSTQVVFIFCPIHFHLAWTTCLSNVKLVKYELLAWSMHEWCNIMNCYDLEYFCVPKMWSLQGIHVKICCRFLREKELIEHYSLTSRFGMAKLSTNSYQGTYYVDQKT